MNFKKIHFLFLLLFSFLEIQAQTPFQIQGGVIDAETKESIPFVNITNLSSTSTGGTTNGEGIFQIEITALPTVLEFSFIGYESQKLEIEDSQTREFIISLRPTSAPLPEVEVNAKRKIDTVFFKPYSVIDYVFFEDKIILLAHRNSIKKYILIALDEKTHEPIAELSLTKYSPKGLLQHCTGEVFLITEANAWEIKVDSNEISFPKEIFLGDFYLIDHPCVFVNEKFLYFARYFYQGQALRYHAYARQLNPFQKSDEAPIPTDSLEKYEFPLIQDEENIVRLIEEVGLRTPWSGDLWDQNVNEGILTLRESDYHLKGIMKIFYPKLIAPIFQKGEEMMVFNHFASTLEFYTEKGDSIRSIPIEYHRTRKWKKQIYFDNIQKRAYTTFNTRWGEEIREIDLEKGTTGVALQIDLAFIEKAKVRNGFIYFLFKDTWRGGRTRILHRMKIN